MKTMVDAVKGLLRVNTGYENCMDCSLDKPNHKKNCSIDALETALAELPKTEEELAKMIYAIIYECRNERQDPAGYERTAQKIAARLAASGATGTGDDGGDTEECSECGGDGVIRGDCGDDTCCCADPESSHPLIPCPSCTATPAAEQRDGCRWTWDEGLRIWTPICTSSHAWTATQRTWFNFCPYCGLRIVVAEEG